MDSGVIIWVCNNVHGVRWRGNSATTNYREETGRSGKTFSGTTFYSGVPGIGQLYRATLCALRPKPGHEYIRAASCHSTFFNMNRRAKNSALRILQQQVRYQDRSCRGVAEISGET